MRPEPGSASRVTSIRAHAGEGAYRLPPATPTALRHSECMRERLVRNVTPSGGALAPQPRNLPRCCPRPAAGAHAPGRARAAAGEIPRLAPLARNDITQEALPRHDVTRGRPRTQGAPMWQGSHPCHMHDPCHIGVELVGEPNERRMRQEGTCKDGDKTQACRGAISCVRRLSWRLGVPFPR